MLNLSSWLGDSVAAPMPGICVGNIGQMGGGADDDTSLSMVITCCRVNDAFDTS